MPLRRSLLAAAVITTLAACTPSSDDDAADAPTGCAATVSAAAAAAEPERQVALLDSALVACASYARFSDEVARHSGIIGFDVDTFLARRCERSNIERVRSTPACEAIAVPITTVPATTVPPLVWVGETFDGRPVEIVPSDRIEFDGDLPAVVQQTVDIATESGCEGVIAQRDLWADRIDDPEIGDEASVFARHAHNVAVWIQCDPTPIPGVEDVELDDLDANDLELDDNGNGDAED